MDRENLMKISTNPLRCQQLENGILLLTENQNELEEVSASNSTKLNFLIIIGLIIILLLLFLLVLKEYIIYQWKSVKIDRRRKRFGCNTKLPIHNIVKSTITPKSTIKPSLQQYNPICQKTPLNQKRFSYYADRAVEHVECLEKAIIRHSGLIRRPNEGLRCYLLKILSPSLHSTPEHRIIHQFMNLYENSKHDPLSFTREDFTIFHKLYMKLIVLSKAVKRHKLIYPTSCKMSPIAYALENHQNLAVLDALKSSAKNTLSNMKPTTSATSLQYNRNNIPQNVGVIAVENLGSDLEADKTSSIQYGRNTN